METCETVTIQTKDGLAVINKSDFDPKTMKLAGKKPAAKGKK